MSRPVSLFSGYSQRENRTTNYCLLALENALRGEPQVSRRSDERIRRRGLGRAHRRQLPPAGAQEIPASPMGSFFSRPSPSTSRPRTGTGSTRSSSNSTLQALDRGESRASRLLIALANFETHRPREIRAESGKLCAGAVQEGSIVFEEVSFEDFVQALQHPAACPRTWPMRSPTSERISTNRSLLPSWRAVARCR